MIRIDEKTHAELKLAIAKINQSVGTSLDILSFTTQAIKEKIENNQILNQN